MRWPETKSNGRTGKNKRQKRKPITKEKGERGSE